MHQVLLWVTTVATDIDQSVVTLSSDFYNLSHNKQQNCVHWHLFYMKILFVLCDSAGKKIKMEMV